MNVAFLNENTLGHTSYLPRFAAELQRRPELGVTPFILDALPLPEHLRHLGDRSVRGLRKVGLDFHGTRWRVAISRHIREQLEVLRRRVRIEALIINTQSAGLELGELTRELPTLVALDATFTQLARSPWFAPNLVARWLQPVTLGGLLRRERRLFAGASRLLPWSEVAAGSLRSDYGVVPSRVTVLPPSLEPPPRRARPSAHARPQLLFLGGDFLRKGGPLLRQVFEQHWVDRAELHLVTQSEVTAGPHVIVHRGVTAGGDAWRQRWLEADLFVFPSRLETFGIVLLEALAFEVPIIASSAGAAREILGDGSFGTVLPELTEPALTAAIRIALDRPGDLTAKAVAGRASFEQRFSLTANTERLAGLLRGEC